MANKKNKDTKKFVSLQMIHPHSIITSNPQTVEWLQKRLVTTIGPAPGTVSTVIPGMPPYPAGVSFQKGTKKGKKSYKKPKTKETGDKAEKAYTNIETSYLVGICTITVVGDVPAVWIDFLSCDSVAEVRVILMKAMATAAQAMGVELANVYFSDDVLEDLRKLRLSLGPTAVWETLEK